MPQASRSTPQSRATSLAVARVEPRLQQKLTRASPLRLRVARRRRISSVSPLAERATTTSPGMSTPRSPWMASAGWRNRGRRAGGAEGGGDLLGDDSAFAHAGDDERGRGSRRSEGPIRRHGQRPPPWGPPAARPGPSSAAASVRTNAAGWSAAGSRLPALFSRFIGF